MDLVELLGEDAGAIHEAGDDYGKMTFVPKYTVDQLRRPESIASVGRQASSLYHTFGLDALRKKNLQLIGERSICYAAGNSVIFENLDTHNKTYLLGLDEGGVGCVAVHPCKKIFAVGGRGYQPKIYIYTFPDMKVRTTVSL